MAKLKKDNLYIIGCSLRNKENEKVYYKKKYINIKFKFIPRSSSNVYSSYEVLNKLKIIVTINSTLGYESLSRLNKTIFLFNRNIKLEKYIKAETHFFGWPKKFCTQGICHSSRFNKISLFNFLKKIYETNDLLWKDKIRSIAHKLLPYKKGNDIIINILKNLIKKKINKNV